MTDQQLVQRGNEAKRLMENEILTEAFEHLEQEYTQAWKRTKATDEAAREKLWMAQNQLEMVKAHLQSVIQTGKVAENKLQKAMRHLRDGLTPSKG